MDFFINRPIFASVIALLMVLAGGICALVLPVAQYPPIAPPQIQISTQYIGAGADVVAKTVTTPIEEDVNGVEDAIYMSSNSTNNGQSIILVTFEIGSDNDINQVNVLNKATQAEPELPDAVNKIGLTIEKQSTNLVLVVNLVSPNGTWDAQFLGNYADIHVYDALMRLKGVASINNLGLRKYAIRIWLDPSRLANLGLTAMDVANAIEEQNQQVAAAASSASRRLRAARHPRFSSTRSVGCPTSRSSRTSSCGPIPMDRPFAWRMLPGSSSAPRSTTGALR